MRQTMALFCCLLFAGSARAQTPAAPAWQPPAPDSRSFDWIRLVSGEWLGGEIKSLRTEKLEFDSDKLKVLTLDWKDVAELRSSKTYTYVFAGRIVERGTASLRDSLIVVSGEGGAQTHRRDQLHSIVPVGEREIDYWDFNVHLGVVTRSGNTDQQDLNSLFKVRRTTALTRLGLNYAGNYGRITGTETINNHSGDVRLDVFLSDRFYLAVPAVNIYSDKFTNIDLRLTPSVGVGMRVIRTPRATLDVDVGGGYQWTRFRSVQPGEDVTADQAAIIPGFTLETEPTGDIDFDLSYNVRIGIPDAKETYHHLLGVLSFELTSVFDFEFSSSWDRVESPRPDANGIVPKRDDFRTSIGLGIEY